MATELAVLESIQAAILTLDDFETGDVSINDWRVLDQSTQRAPYVILETADDLAVTQLASGFVYFTTWSVPFTLVERFVDWRESYDALRDRREAVFGAIVANVGTGLYVAAIRSDGPVSEIFATGADPANSVDALPVFVAQRFIVEVQER